MGVDLRDGAATASAPTSSTRTPGTPTSRGHVASLLGGMPHVVTAHSLEPMRPWKAEQLGGGYRVSSFVERTAYEAAAAVIAVSEGMRQDVLRSYPSIDPERVKVVHNGIDSQLWQRHRDDGHRAPARRRPRRPVGHLRRPDHPAEGPALPAARAPQLPPDVQLVLCAGAPDTPEIMAEVEAPDGRAARHPRGRRVDPRDAAARARSSPLLCPPRSSPAPRSTSRSASSTSRRWPASWPSWPPRPAASPRSSSTARPAGWCRSTRSRTAAASRSTPTGSSPTSRPRSPTPSATRPGPAAMGLAGRQRAVDSFSWATIGERTNQVYRTVLDH